MHQGATVWHPSKPEEGELAPSSPTVARAEFAIRMRQRRHELGLSAEVVRAALGVSRVYFSALENSRATMSLARLPSLIEILEFNHDATALEELLTTAHETGWWVRYREYMNEEFEEFVGLEHGASCIRQYEARVITGLLQTREYATEVVKAAPDVSSIATSRNVDIRMTRQKRLLGTDPPRLELVLTEGTLLQEFGDPAVLTGQLTHLLNLVDSNPDWLELRVQPFAITPLGLTGASTIALLGFESSRMPTAVWREAVQPVGISFEEDLAASVDMHLSKVLESSLDPEASRDLIAATLRNRDL